MTFSKTLPRAMWKPSHFWLLNENNKKKRISTYPEELFLLWVSDSWELSLKGPAPVYTDVPEVTSAGVTPGDGPAFTSVVTWTKGGTLVVRFTATTASADIVGDVQVFGPVYVCSTGLKAKDGTNTAECLASWAATDVITAVMQVADGALRIGSEVVAGPGVEPEGSIFIGWENVDGVPSETPESFYSAQLVTYLQKWTADVTGTLKTLNVYVGAWDLAPRNQFVVVYRDNAKDGNLTLLGYASYSGVEAAWTGPLTLVAASGQALTFSSGDDLYFGGMTAANSTAGQTYQYGRMDAGGPGAYFSNSLSVATGVRATITGLSFGTGRKPAGLLEVEV